MSTTPTHEPRGSEFLTVAQAAAHLNVSQAFLYGTIEAGELPAHRFGRTIRITRAELEALAARATERPVRGRPRTKPSDSTPAGSKGSKA